MVIGRTADFAAKLLHRLQPYHHQSTIAAVSNNSPKLSQR